MEETPSAFPQAETEKTLKIQVDDGIDEQPYLIVREVDVMVKL